METGKKPLTRECPHLGHRKDITRVYGYPTDLNVCHAQQSVKRKHWFSPSQKRPYRPISLHQQEAICMDPANWRTCSIYLQTIQSAPQPERPQTEASPSDDL